MILFGVIALGQRLGAWELRPFLSQHPDLCLFHRISGWDCPGCGMGRSLLHAILGEWHLAWDTHPGGPLLLGLTALVAFLPPRAQQALEAVLQGQRGTWIGPFCLALLLAWWLKRLWFG